MQVQTPQGPSPLHLYISPTPSACCWGRMNKAPHAAYLCMFPKTPMQTLPSPCSYF